MNRFLVSGLSWDALDPFSGLALLFLVLLMLAISGCSSAPDKDSIEFSLQEQGLFVTDISKGMSGITFTYESATANEHDGQIIDHLVCELPN